MNKDNFMRELECRLHISNGDCAMKDCALCELNVLQPHWSLAEFLRAASDLITELRTAQTWIPVTDALPEPDTVVIACFDDGDISTVHQSWRLEGPEALIYKGFNTNDHDQTVTHWTPLPKPPEEVQHE